MAYLISYLRVSTVQQGHSGLGLEAQREAIRKFAEIGRHVIIEEFIEVDSGGNNNRIKLAQALERCKLTGATLVMKTLDRLARNVRFIASLIETNVDFIITDMPDANKLTLHILASIGEWEKDAISSRTKAALQAAKARGTLLGVAGKLNLTSEAKAKGRQEAVKVIVQNSINFARRLEPLLNECINNNMNLVQIAARLTELQVMSARGKTKWYPAMVSNCLKILRRLK